MKKETRFLSRSVHHAKILIGKISREGVQSRQKVWLTAFPSRKVMKSIQCRIGMYSIVGSVISFTYIGNIQLFALDAYKINALIRCLLRSISLLNSLDL